MLEEQRFSDYAWALACVVLLSTPILMAIFSWMTCTQNCVLDVIGTLIGAIPFAIGLIILYYKIYLKNKKQKQSEVN